MSNRAINVAARIVFFLSGLISFAVAAPYVLLRGSNLPSQSEWIIMAAVLAVIGAVSILVAILPARWIAWVSRAQDEDSVLSFSLKMFFLFAVVSYLLTAGLYFTPREWNLEGNLLTFLLCPVYIVRVNFDPAPLLIFGPLGLMNATVYGATGNVFALAWRTFRRDRAAKI
jgi:hypothetical protein